MKKIILIFLILHSLISCGQNSTKKQKIELDKDEIEFSSITYNKTIPGYYNKIDVRILSKQQIDELVKTLNNAKPRGLCKLGATFTIKTYLKNDSIRNFRGNNKTIKEKTDFCFTLSDDDFYNNLWKNSDSIKIDLTKITILPFNDFNAKMLNSQNKANLNEKELKEIEIILQNKLDTEKIKELSEYFRQYVSVYNSKNEKEVWINFLCKTNDSNWRKERAVLKDGGNCCFNIKINLKTGKIYAFYVNGES